MDQIKNKIALVTGSSRGIGKAIAFGLADSGYQLILTARNIHDLQKVSDEITFRGGHKPALFALNITRYEEVKNMISRILAEFKRIDVLVNNAGIYFDGTMELPLQEFELMLETNLTAQFRLLQLVIPIMKQQQTGYIFNIASRSGKVGFAGTGGYCASKFGLVGLNESLYNELVPAGIRVTALCPAWVDTEMATQAGSELKPEEMIQPADLYETISWLLKLSPGACVKEVIITNPKSL